MQKFKLISFKEKRASSIPRCEQEHSELPTNPREECEKLGAEKHHKESYPEGRQGKYSLEGQTHLLNNRN